MPLPAESRPNLPFGLSTVEIGGYEYTVESADIPNETTRTNGRVTELEHRMEAKDRVDDKQSDAIGKIRWTVAWAAGFGAAVGALASFIVKLI